MFSERSLDQGAGVIQAHVVFAVELGCRWRGFAGDDAAAEATKGRRIAAGVEIDSLEQRRMNHRRPDANVEQQRHADTVQEIARVAWGRTANEEEGQPRDDGRDAWHDLDRPEWVAEGAGDLPHFRARERGGTRWIHLDPAHLDLDRPESWRFRDGRASVARSARRHVVRGLFILRR